jgi:hypothetical protein
MKVSKYGTLMRNDSLLIANYKIQDFIFNSSKKVVKGAEEYFF